MQQFDDVHLHHASRAQHTHAAAPHRMRAAALQPHEHHTTPQAAAAFHRRLGTRQVTGTWGNWAETKRCSQCPANAALGYGKHLTRAT
jgi:hypothetical protein